MTPIINRLKNFNFAKLLYHEEKIGGLSITEEKIHLTYLGEKGEILFEKEIPLAPDTVLSGVLKNETELLQALKQLESKEKLLSRSVIVSLPTTVAQPFIFEFFPNLKQEEITNALSLIVDSSLPLSKEEIYADWEEIAVPQSAEFQKKKFLLAMGIKSLIDPYLAALKKSNLVAVACETHGWSLPRATDFKNEPFLVVSFESKQIVFAAYKDNTLVFQFELPKEFQELAIKSGDDTSAAPPDKKEEAQEAQIKDITPTAKGKSKKAKKETVEKVLEEKIKPVAATSVQAATPAANSVFNRSVLFTERISHFLLSDREYNFEVKKILILGKKEERDNFLSLLSEDRKKFVVGEESVSGDRAKLFSLGSARRGLLPRRDDTISSLMPIGTELAYERQRLISFLDFFQKLAIALGGFFIILFAGTLLMINVISRTTVKTLSEQQIDIPEGFTEIKQAADSFNRDAAILAGLMMQSPKWENLFVEIDKAVNPGLLVNKLEVSRGSAVVIAGSAQDRTNLLQFRNTLQDSPVFLPITLPLSALIAKQNIPFSFNLVLKNPGIINAR